MKRERLDSSQLEERLHELFRGDGPAMPSPDLLTRIMNGVADAEPTRFERWNHVALPVALAAGIAAIVVGLLGFVLEPRTPTDPVAEITRVVTAEVGDLFAAVGG